jgi:hypothetical protein
MPHQFLSSLFYHPHNIGWGVQIIKLLIIRFYSLSCYLIPLRPKYSPQHPILKHPQPAFFPHCQRPSFTPIQSNMQNHSSSYLNQINKGKGHPITGHQAEWPAPRPGRFSPGKDPVPIVQEAGWAPGPVWTCAINLVPTGIFFLIRSPVRPACSQ